MVGIFLLIFRGVSDSTNFANFIIFYQLLTNLLKNQLILMYNLFLYLVFEKSLNNNHLSSKLLKWYIFRNHYPPYGILIRMLFLVCENRNIILHGVNQTHVHATHILFKAATLWRLTIFTLTRYWLTASKLWSQDTHIQQFGDYFIVFDEGWLSPPFLKSGAYSLGNGVLGKLELVFSVIWDIARGHVSMFDGFSGFG